MSNKALAIACISLLLVTAVVKFVPFGSGYQTQQLLTFAEVVQLAAWVGLFAVVVRALLPKKKAPE